MPTRSFLRGASIVGPVKSSLLASIEPISAVFFAFMIMGDIFYPVDFLGMAMILLAVTIISLKDLMLEKKQKVYLKTEQPYKEVVFLCSSINLINFKIESL